MTQPRTSGRRKPADHARALSDAATTLETVRRDKATVDRELAALRARKRELLESERTALAKRAEEIQAAHAAGMAPPVIATHARALLGSVHHVLQGPKGDGK